MAEADRTMLEAALSRHYASKRESCVTTSVDDLVAAMMAEDSRMRRSQPRNMALPAFVAAQVRYIPAWTWLAHLGLVSLMFITAHASGDIVATKLAVGVLSAAAVLVGVPTVQASKFYGVAELEYSCPHDAASVLMARLIILGCSSSLSVAIMIALTAASLGISAFTVTLWACPPFFCSCAGSLMLLRKAPPSTATTLCIAWAGVCTVALVTAGAMFPHMYAQASLAVWAGAAAAACAWLVRETIYTFRAVTAGLDTFSPHMARTYN